MTDKFSGLAVVVPEVDFDDKSDLKAEIIKKAAYFESYKDYKAAILAKALSLLDALCIACEKRDSTLMDQASGAARTFLDTLPADEKPSDWHGR